MNGANEMSDIEAKARDGFAAVGKRR